MTSDPVDPTAVGHAHTCGAVGPAPSVALLWARVAAEWGIDFEPAPAAMVTALPELTAAVEDVLGRLPDAQKRRWLAAALAALVHHVQAGTLN